jgi:hypothetical protein
VGRPPQELMRGWGRAPICKDFRPDRRLGIRDTCNLDEEGKKRRCGGQRNTCEECRDKRLSSRVQGRTKKLVCFGRKKWLVRL